MQLFTLCMAAKDKKAGLSHRCQPSSFRWDSPEFNCYVPLSRFTNSLSHILSSAVSAVQQLVHS